MSVLDEYDRLLFRLLDLPEPFDEAPGAFRVARAIFRPSFHPECAISLAQTEDGAVLTIRSLLRQGWQHLQERHGNTWGSLDGWVEPALSVEQVKLPSTRTELLDKLSQLVSERGESLGIDGMPCTGEFWTSNGSRTHQAWSPRRAGGDADRFFLLLHRIALECCSWEQSRKVLEAIGDYMR